MKFFSFVNRCVVFFRPYVALINYKIRTWHIVKKPGGIDPAVKAYVENLERGVFAIIQEAKRLILAKELRPGIIIKYLEIINTQVNMIEKIRCDNPHPCYDRLGRYAEKLRDLAIDLEAQLVENTTP